MLGETNRAAQGGVMGKLRLVASLVALLLITGGSAEAQKLRVLVTNDDGIASPGITTLVNQLVQNSNLEVVVVAPAVNQSGSGDQTTTSGTLQVSPGATATGFAGTAVQGFPADSVLFGVRQVLPAPPDLVVSGVNQGQNITREISEISGTVGAALTAARLGIPAIAVSQGLAAAIDYTRAAQYAAAVVENFRAKPTLGKKMISANGLDQRIVLSINFPSCSAGSVRGVEVVPLARLFNVTSYNLVADDGETQTYSPVTVAGSPFASNCTSTLTKPKTDLEAMNNGFASLTPLNPDFTVDSKLKKFSFLKKLF
jgi:5'-nucleotidase